MDDGGHGGGGTISVEVAYTKHGDLSYRILRRSNTISLQGRYTRAPAYNNNITISSP